MCYGQATKQQSRARRTLVKCKREVNVQSVYVDSTEYGTEVDLFTALEQRMYSAMLDNRYLGGPKKRVERDKADQSDAESNMPPLGWLAESVQ